MAGGSRPVRDWLGYPSTIMAAALVVLGLLFLGIVAQSPTRLYWTGQHVNGTVHGGIVYYRVDGQRYTVDDAVGGHPEGSRLTVYVDRGDPTHAMLYRPAKWVDAAAVLVWFAGAVVVLLAGAARRAWSAGRRRELERSLGL